MVPHDPAKPLQILLQEDAGSGAEAALDALYRTALESVGRWDDTEFVEDFRSILGVILVARDPLSHSAIDGLFNADGCRPSMHTISRLACVLGHNPTVRILHPSFSDFLMNRTRSRRDVWYIDRDFHNRRIAIKCLERMDGALKRNICGLPLVPDWPTSVREQLSQDLVYACVSWIEHICLIEEEDPSIVNYLNGFLHRHLLHWLEVMSILRRSRETITLLECLHSWVKVCRPKSCDVTFLTQYNSVTVLINPI